MKIIYLPSAGPDVAWFRRYYRVVFPAGARSASRHFAAAIDMPAENPLAGRLVDGTTARKLGIARTPFSIYYEARSGEIRILRVFDHRSGAAPVAQT